MSDYTYLTLARLRTEELLEEGRRSRLHRRHRPSRRHRMAAGLHRLADHLDN